MDLWITSFNGYTSSIDILDVWGEGRVVSGGLTTGFDNCVNLNTFSQTASRGENRGNEIPNLCPVASRQAPRFPVSTGVVRRITMMGGPMDHQTASEMVRVLHPSLGVVYLYDPSPEHQRNFDWAMAGTGLARRTLTVLEPPFDEISKRPVFVCAYRDL